MEWIQPLSWEVLYSLPRNLSYMTLDYIVCLSLFVTAITVRNTLVTYDREHERIGFLKTNCSELWKRLHLTPTPTPAPLHSSTHEVNSTTNVAPMLAPAEPPLAKPPGIIYYSSLNIIL